MKFLLTMLLGIPVVLLIILVTPTPLVQAVWVGMAAYVLSGVMFSLRDTATFVMNFRSPSKEKLDDIVE